MTERTIFLFDPSYRLLGECVVVGGSCRHIGLNAAGEQIIGKEMELLASSLSDAVIPFTEWLREWADHSGMFLVSFPADRVYLWHRISSAPCSDADRYALAFAISHASSRQQEVWERQLADTFMTS
jgi:hypothetical protein